MSVFIKDIEIGGSQPVFIAGPCIIENEDMLDKTAQFLSGLSRDIKVILKCSYDKANRSSSASFRGPGIEKGLEIISRVKEKYSLPVLCDVHCRSDINKLAGTVDCIQIPAFLCRQTDLIEAAAASGKPVNIKKGQFISPYAMGMQADKAMKIHTSKGVMLTERGTFFGYSDLVVDMRSIIIMKETGCPVIFDASHSQQKPPAGNTDETGGAGEFIVPLAVAARSVGADGIFCEIHPDPANAKSDRGTQLDFDTFTELTERIVAVKT
jgi:2-dehydro-3-deoxyphosphooctonate aldolase (KDO 8-P synthase)